MRIAPAEKTMWEHSSSKNGKHQMTDEEINNKYERGQQRILTEMNREKLPSFAESLKKPNYMDVSPFYQRRLRWDKTKQLLQQDSQKLFTGEGRTKADLQTRIQLFDDMLTQIIAE